MIFCFEVLIRMQRISNSRPHFLLRSLHAISKVSFVDIVPPDSSTLRPDANLAIGAVGVGFSLLVT